MGEQKNLPSTEAQLAQLHEEVARLKAQMAEMDPTASFEKIGEPELRNLIQHLRPDREMYAGKKFLLALLDSRGIQGVDAFVNKALKAMSEGDGLDLPHHFDIVETEIFKKTALHLWHRKEFLTTLAWSVPGIVLLAKTPLDLASLATDEKPKPKENDPHPALHMAQKVAKDLSVASDIPLAAALIYEGVRHDYEMRLEHIADAVSELADRIKQEQKQNKQNSR